MSTNKVLAQAYELAKADGRLCTRCQWIVTKGQWQKGIRLCAGCQDALKGVNISYGWGTLRPRALEPNRRTLVMAVYVDKARNPFGRMIMCHMLADTLPELHAMAGKLGLKREWFQPKSSPHYDVSLAKRAQVLELGATEIDNKQLVELVRKLRNG